MNKIHLVSLAAVLAISGCSKNNESPAVASTPTNNNAADAVAQASVPEPAPTVPLGDAVLADDIRPAFRHRVRSSAQETEPDGAVKHRMNIEFIDVDPAEVAASLRSSFEAKGYKVAGPSAQADGAEKYVAFSTTGDKVQYSIAPKGQDLKVKLGAPGARGLVGVIWVDRSGG